MIQETILVLNIGSSSIKFVLFSLPLLGSLYNGHVDITPENLLLHIKDSNNIIIHKESFKETNYIQQQNHAIKLVFDWLHKQESYLQVKATGHRIVHGGEQFTSPIRIDKVVICELEKLIPLAPLHQPFNIAGIKAVLETHPDLLQVACFDTAFHADQPDIARYYALPKNITPLKIQSYGFHGLSYQYITQTLPPEIANQKNIIAHLGNGASLCAIENKKSIATTMGFSTLDGLVMGTRCGSIDPGVILYLLANGFDLQKLTELLYNHSGLLGVSQISSDMRALSESNDLNAHKAIELFVYRAAREIGSLLSTLGGIDNLIFTAGIGENSHSIREKICLQLSWLDIKISPTKNTSNEKFISTDDSKIKIWVIPTNEELLIAQETQKFLLNSL